MCLYMCLYFANMSSMLSGTMNKHVVGLFNVKQLFLYLYQTY